MLRFAELELSPFTFTAVAAVSALAAGMSAYLLRGTARSVGLASRSRRDRFGEGGVPLIAGPSMLIGALLAMAALRPVEALVPFAVGVGFFAIGLADDFRSMRPGIKLAWQALAAVLAAHLLALPMAPSVLAFLLLVNAFNYLDNMDGLMIGVALASATCLLLVPGGSHVGATLLVWVLPGVLFFNLPPARIYCGDSGSHFVGALFAVDALLLVHDPMAGFRLDRGFALLVLFAVPLADVATVSISRRMRGRSVFRGGTDHLSHRLVRTGWTVPVAVGLLVLASAVCGIAALFLLYQAS